MEQHYCFSGSLTVQMADELERLMHEGKWQPADALVSQLDKSGITSMMSHMERGIIKSLFIDSGAYSVHTGRIKVTNDEELKAFVDDYIDFVNSIDDKILAVAQVDHIPGVFKQPKKPEDYVESVKLSWDNFLYMLPKMKSPEKLIYVFHQGESFDALQHILDWRDENGKPLQYLGISPSNDRAVGDKDIYLKEVYDFIAKSSNPTIHTHLFGYTSLPGLPKFPWYSCDSVSHRLRAAYNKVFTRDYGTISFSMTREARTTADKCFCEIADEETLRKFDELLDYYGFTREQMMEESSARTALDMCEVQRYCAENPYAPEKILRARKLFKI